MLRICVRPFGFRFLTKSTSKHFVFAYAPADTLMVLRTANRLPLEGKLSRKLLAVYETDEVEED